MKSTPNAWQPLRRTIFVALGLVMLFFGIVIMLQARLIFFPERLPANFEFELDEGESEVFVKTADGATINALWTRVAPKPGRGVVLYFHGNAGSLRTWKEVAPDFTSLGYDVFIIDYRGFGKSTGSLSEAGLYEDARASWSYLLEHGYEPDDIVIYGRSIGSGVASELAAKVAARGLILESPFTSLLAIAKSLYPFLLPGLILRFRFETDKRIEQVKSPILLIHGGQDELIPVQHSRALHSQLAERSELVVVDEGGHNDLSVYPAYRQALTRFLAP